MMVRWPRSSVVRLALATLLAGALEADAHSGPPYPLVSDRVVGPYRISVWTDPDATDDASKGGQFWVMIEPAAGGPVPSGTRADVSIRALDRPGAVADTAPAQVEQDPSRQFAALRMDHEGPYAVQVRVSGPAGAVVVDTEVTATYDLRPARALLVLYLVPFVLVGFLWIKLLVRRRRARYSRTPLP